MQTVHKKRIQKLITNARFLVTDIKQADVILRLCKKHDLGDHADVVTNVILDFCDKLEGITNE